MNQTPFYKMQTDLEDTQIKPIGTINRVTQARADGACANRDQPDIKDNHSQSQARQAREGILSQE